MNLVKKKNPKFDNWGRGGGRATSRGDKLFCSSRHGRKTQIFLQLFRWLLPPLTNALLFWPGHTDSVCSPSLCRRLKESAVFPQNYTTREEKDEPRKKKVELKWLSLWYRARRPQLLLQRSLSWTPPSCCKVLLPADLFFPWDKQLRIQSSLWPEELLWQQG